MHQVYQSLPVQFARVVNKGINYTIHTCQTDCFERLTCEKPNVDIEFELPHTSEPLLVK